jgi:hypothetical protein
VGRGEGIGAIMGGLRTFREGEMMRGEIRWRRGLCIRVREDMTETRSMGGKE